MESLLILILFLSLIVLVTFNKTLYCFVYEHKKWKLWKHYIKNYNKFEYTESISGNYIFVNLDENIIAVLWKNGLCSIHNSNNNCILSEFDEHNSSKMKELLLGKLNVEK